MTSQPIYKVFVSSTSRDLQEERAEVEKALLKLNCFPVGMEIFPSADDETWEFIKEQIDDSDYYLLLIAGCYGIVGSDGISFIEKEYDYARQSSVPSIAFIHGDRTRLPNEKVENNPSLLAKLDLFIERVRRRPVRGFLNSHQLALEVTTSFIDLRRKKPRVGFVRTDSRVDFKKYAELQDRNTDLEGQIKELKKRISELEQQNTIFEGYDRNTKIALRGKTAEHVISIAWMNIFRIVASNIIADPAEQSIAKGLAQACLHELDADQRSMLGKSIPDIGDLPSVRECLFAKGLIDTVKDHNSVAPGKLAVVSWRLTDYGKRQFSLIHDGPGFPSLPVEDYDHTG